MQIHINNVGAKMSGTVLRLMIVCATISACSANMNKAPGLVGRWERSFDSSDLGAGRIVMEFSDSARMNMDVIPNKAGWTLHSEGTYQLHDAKLAYDISRIGKQSADIVVLTSDRLVLKYSEEDWPQEFKRIK